MLWRLNASKITHQLCCTFCNKCPLFAKLFSISNTMIRFIRCAKSRELIRMCHPVKLTGINDCTTDCCSVSIHIFCRRVRHNICPPLDRPAIHRRWECIIHDQRHTMRVRSLRKLFNIQYRQCRISNRLTKNRTRIILKCCI